MHYDVFNGDADGIFALHQLRLAEPVADARLITGVKRDINLLERIAHVRSCRITVLDVSLDKNRAALMQLLDNDNRLRYIDHHYAGDVPGSDMLEHHIEVSPNTCTSLIVNTLLQDRYAPWAVCGAFGDNLDEQALQLAQAAGIGSADTDTLREMGELFNYNGYGTRIEDLQFHPADLYLAIRKYDDPLHFFASTDVVPRLRRGYQEDMARAAEAQDIAQNGRNRVYRLPAAPWSRRIAGVFSNLKARERRDCAHAIIVGNDDGSLQISVRAPLSAKGKADELCRMFPTGGGRAAAAGINRLPEEKLDVFLNAFHSIYQ